MEIIQRYLDAIELWLPKGQRHDIIAEISEDIHSQIDEQQSALGRNLTEAELEVLLQQRGRPVLVANRYRAQQFLIGPVWFPTYVFVLKIVGLCYVLPWLFTFVVVQRLQQPATEWGMTMLAAWGTFWTVVFTAAGAVTLVFSLLQWIDIRTHFLEKWSPRKLSPVRDPYKISRYNSVSELVFGVAFILAWIAYASSPVIVDGPTFKLSLAPVWLNFFWGSLAVALFKIALAAINLQRPYWTGWRAACRLASDLAGGVLFCWLLRTNIIATIFIPNIDSPRAINAIHLLMVRCLPIAVIISVIVVTIDLFRIFRVSRKGTMKGVRDVKAGLTSGVVALIAVALTLL